MMCEKQPPPELTLVVRISLAASGSLTLTGLPGPDHVHPVPQAV
jgi:hypothetical protein